MGSVDKIISRVIAELTPTREELEERMVQPYIVRAGTFLHQTGLRKELGLPIGPEASYLTWTIAWHLCRRQGDQDDPELGFDVYLADVRNADVEELLMKRRTAQIVEMVETEPCMQAVVRVIDLAANLFVAAGFNGERMGQSLQEVMKSHQTLVTRFHHELIAARNSKPQ